MNTTLIARKDWANAAAFIELNKENGEVRVYSKFYKDRQEYEGPTTDVLAVMSGDLFSEAKHKSWTDKKSKKLASYCKDIWLQAQESNSWFGYKA